MPRRLDFSQDQVSFGQLRTAQGGRPVSGLHTQHLCAHWSDVRQLRVALFMPALVAATRTKSPFAESYQRLRDAGKPNKIALTAVMRKLVITLNAIIRDNRKYQT